MFTAWKRLRENTILLKALEEQGKEQKDVCEISLFIVYELYFQWLKRAKEVIFGKGSKKEREVVRQNSLLTGKEKVSVLSFKVLFFSFVFHCFVCLFRKQRRRLLMRK